MYFDKLCGLAERHRHDILPLIHDAKIFHLPGRWHEFGKDAISEEELACQAENFFLPFPVIAVEDTASVVIIADTVKNQVGFDQPRIFIECLPQGVPDSEFNDTPEVQKRNSQVPYEQGECVLTYGKITKFAYRKSPTTPFLYAGGLTWAMVATKRECTLRKHGYEIPGFMADGTLRNACAALEEVFYFNTPNRFIVEITPTKGKILDTPRYPLRAIRSGERRSYTLLTPGEIRKTLGLNGTGLPLEEGHFRRRHTRTLRSDRYVNMKGRVLTIPATWVGPDEGIKNGKLYKVRLDL